MCITDMNVLLKAADACISKSSFKKSTQLFEWDRMLWCYNIKKEILCGKYKPKESAEFVLNERGKKRAIKAPCIADRVVQKALCETAVLPAITPRIIHDNGASLKNKGLAFARRRFEQHVHECYRKHGGGWLLMLDFSKYFDNLRHKTINEDFQKLLPHAEFEIFRRVIDDFAPDVSYMTREEYGRAMETLYNALDHIGYHGTKEKRLAKGVNIGAELSQPIGVYYPHSVDDYIKTVCGERWYGRYMDDSYLISESKGHLLLKLREIRQRCMELGITLNEKKTRIVPITKPFVFLKMKYHLTKTGHLCRRPTRETFARERRRVKQLATQYEAGEIDRDYAVNCYKSWRKSFKKLECRKTINGIDKCFARSVGRF